MLSKERRLKCGTVSSGAIGLLGGRLDAEFYLDPTGEIDRRIAILKKCMARDRASLNRLLEERGAVLERFHEAVRPLVKGVSP